MKLYSLLFILILSGCGKYCPSYSFNSASSRWEILPVKLHPNLSPPYEEALYKAINTWETAYGRPLFKVSSEGFNIYFDENLAPGEQGRTRLYFINRTIYFGEIRINPKAPADPESLFLHELGHFLGLKHEDEGYDHVMSSHLGFYQKRRELDSWALEGVRCLYE
jgi:hypothetical protein